MTDMLNSLWVEKYRPKNVFDYIFQDTRQKKLIVKYILDEEIPHLLLSGVQGTGKTTISKILINELNIDTVDVLTINCSDENSVDVMRDKITSFITTFAMGKFKVVQLEECDFATINAQAILRHLMEEYHHIARFILTCNYVHKIIPAIQSRCQHLEFKQFSTDDLIKYTTNILEKEKIEFNPDYLKEYISVYKPDIRKIINELQKNTYQGTLLVPGDGESNSGDYKFKILDLLKENEWKRIRVLLCSNVLPNEWETVYRFLYDNLDKCNKFADDKLWNQGILIIADHLYKHSLCADPEINVSAMLIKLGDL